MPIETTVPDILTIPKILIIIQISLSLWFQNCMTLGVCLSLSPVILNIPDIPDIPDTPEFPLFLKLRTFPIYYHVDQVIAILEHYQIISKMAWKKWTNVENHQKHLWRLKVLDVIYNLLCTVHMLD